MNATGSAGPHVRLASGTVCGQTEGGLAVFRGVPFARPPVCEWRLAAPMPVEPWEGVREAVAFGPPPPQSRVMGAPAVHDSDGNWLTVNIWSPDPGAARLPVMVWIHGGGYVYGWSGDPLFDGAALARDGVVVVTFNYRLSAEGFGHFPGAPANRGLLDQVAALRWVQDNIAAFGGDPARVTVFGESAGAGSIAALMVMPSATGLFQRAIAQSVPGLYFSEALATDIGAAITGHLRLPPSAVELARLSPSRLNDAADEVAGTMAANLRWSEAAHVRSPFAPIVDGEVLPAVPWEALAGGAAPGVELIVGHTRDEYRLFMAVTGELGAITPEQTDAVLKRDYNRMLELGGNIYFTAKLGATDGHSFRHLAATMTGSTQEDYAAMMLAGGRSVEGNRSKSGKDKPAKKSAAKAKPAAKAKSKSSKKRK